MMRIPKVIHLCWFSGDEYPDIIKKCIDSWRRVLPDFEIKIWTKEMALETNILYVKEAISVRKWAFAADVIRLWAVYHEGGVYMDSDIYILHWYFSKNIMKICYINILCLINLMTEERIFLLQI